MIPEELFIDDFSYELPDGKVAIAPVSNRDESKLLVYKNGLISESIYQNLANHIPVDSLVVFNNTKVVEARIHFQKMSGGIVEIFCLEHDEKYGTVTNGLSQIGSVQWKCLVGGASKWKCGQQLEKVIVDHNSQIILHANFLAKEQDHFLIELEWLPATLTFAEVLHKAGAIPLPPYIKRAIIEEDNERYQTIYAKHDGSVAAPTAGLHFTEGMFDALQRKNIKKEFITLHVGAGTFMPVKVEQLKDHQMHGEYFEVSYSFLQKLLMHIDNPIVAVGTTSLRTLESIFWAGAKIALRITDPLNADQQVIHISQWQAYEIESQDVLPADAVKALLNWMDRNKLERIIGNTQLLIAPGYSFKIVSGLVTNFHQPRSTLLLLVAALVGQDWKKIYAYALANDFRFLSYGDGSLLWNKM